MHIKDIPWYNRPGNRLKRSGVETLSDSELFAIILTRGNKKENAIDLSNRLLKDYNFPKLADLSFGELKTETQDQVKAMKIIAFFELHKRINHLFKDTF